MNEDETTDNYPILNSFLTTIHEHSPAATPRESSPRQTSQPFTKQVDDWFQAESKALQAKKQRELVKQNRLKQLEDQFEAQRLKKMKELDQKLTNIERNKNKNIMGIQEKLHKLSVRHNKVFTKVQDEHLKEIRENYHNRKAYDIESSKQSTRLITASQQSSDSRNRSLRDPKTKTLEHEIVSNRMNEISQRMEKAKTMSRQKNEETISKARNHNVFELYQVQSKAKEHYNNYLSQYASKIVSKMESADLNKDKIEKQLEKKNEERHKAYSEKLKKIQNNLVQLQEQQEQKFEELSKKLQKPNSSAKERREHRETLYHKRFLSNLQQLEHEKISRADQIIQKHQQITLKNRLFKEKKQTLYKNLKVEGQ